MTAIPAEGKAVPILQQIAPLVEAGFSLHWLPARSKKPNRTGWPEAPIQSLAELANSYCEGNNVGVRLGKPSATAAGFVHALDIDIRLTEAADEAWQILADLFPGIPLTDFPSVISGSGGQSRHIYFFTERPFQGRMLATSSSKFQRFDAATGREVESNAWEIDLFGTGRQIVLPPSIHPSTGRPYRWGRVFNFGALEFGIGPTIAADIIEGLGVAETCDDSYTACAPEILPIEQIKAVFDELPNICWNDYEKFCRYGMVIHHHTGGSEEGLALWKEFAARCTNGKFDKKFLRENRRKWRGFEPKPGRRPVTIASIKAEIGDFRLQAAFEEVDVPETSTSQSAALDLTDDELLGGPIFGPAGGPAPHRASAPEFTDEDLLGGRSPDADDDIDVIGKPATAAKPLSWVKLLDHDSNGKCRSTLHNAELMLKSDSRLEGLPQLNEFTQETVQRRSPGRKAMPRKNNGLPTKQLGGTVWHVNDPVNGDLWNSDRDFAIRSIIEAPPEQGGYGIKISDRDLKGAILLAARHNQFHPVREYLGNLTWDGKARMERLFVDYLGASDDDYHREAARNMLIAAVMRIHRPGSKFDFAVVIEGAQGKRKSTFVKILAKSWYVELTDEFHDAKKVVENLQGAWIVESPEMTGFDKIEVRRIKAFISRTEDKIRMAYEARAARFPRQCVVIATTNDKAYLRDATGGRRFWPIECKLPDGVEIDTDRLIDNIDQIWAEAVVAYKALSAQYPAGDLPLFLRSAAAREAATELQEARRIETEEDTIAGQVAVWLAKPIANGGFDEDQEGQRWFVTCRLEIWTECLGRKEDDYHGRWPFVLGKALAKIPGWRDGKQYNFRRFGLQRGFWREGYVAELFSLSKEKPSVTPVSSNSPSQSGISACQ